MTDLKLNITHQKILDTVYYLNQRHEYPSHIGVYKIVTGTIDEETTNYMDVPTFGTLISFASKKVSRFILPLLRYGYLAKIYDKKTDDLYLVITNKGIEALNLFHKRYKKPYPKKNKTFRQTIAKIEK